jgi:1-deoxy-D-xylulose-5-phosphate reductoisomerase
LTKKIVILGSTGSIGRQTLQVVDEFPDEYRVVALAAGTNMDLLAQQIIQYKPQFVTVSSETAKKRLRQILPDEQITVFVGEDGLLNLAELEGIDLILVALTGINGLRPTLAALDRGITVALANKETLVTAGSLVMKKVLEKGARLIPVDSEHSAIFQCYDEANRLSVEKLLVTASGGPFLNYSVKDLESVTPKKALQHPKWKMGVKITIDSAGLINKGLEVIEAHWLFSIPYEKIDVLIHPQSIVHSMVEYVDGSVIAQCGLPDMRVPIQYALSYPKRNKNSFPKLDFTKVGELTFSRPDYDKFPGLGLAYEAGKMGGTMPTVYNAANEQAVDLFLKGKIKFTSIPVLIGKVMSKHVLVNVYNIDDILYIDKWARKLTQELS